MRFFAKNIQSSIFNRRSRYKSFNLSRYVEPFRRYYGKYSPRYTFSPRIGVLPNSNIRGIQSLLPKVVFVSWHLNMTMIKTSGGTIFSCIGVAVLSQLTNVTNKQTDERTLVSHDVDFITLSSCCAGEAICLKPWGLNSKYPNYWGLNLC